MQWHYVLDDAIWRNFHDICSKKNSKTVTNRILTRPSTLLTEALGKKNPILVGSKFTPMFIERRQTFLTTIDFQTKKITRLIVTSHSRSQFGTLTRVKYKLKDLLHNVMVVVITCCFAYCYTIAYSFHNTRTFNL